MMPKINWKRLEEVGALIAVATSAVIYALAVFTYGHATFLTKEEAAAHRVARDRENQGIVETLKAMDVKLDTLLMERRNGK